MPECDICLRIIYLFIYKTKQTVIRMDIPKDIFVDKKFVTTQDNRKLNGGSESETEAKKI